MFLDMGISGLFRAKFVIAWEMYDDSSGSKRWFLDCKTIWAACSHPTRLKINTIAGSKLALDKSLAKSLYLGIRFCGLTLTDFKGRPDRVALSWEFFTADSYVM